MLVLRHGIGPLKRTYILSLTYPREGMIFPSSLMSPMGLQQRVNLPTLKDMLGLMQSIQYIFKCVVDNYVFLLLLHMWSVGGGCDRMFHNREYGPGVAVFSLTKWLQELA